MDNLLSKNKVVHIKHQQKNRKKSITFLEDIENISDNPKEIEKMIKYFRGKLCCSVTLKKKEGEKPFIEFFGDHREAIKEFLVKEKFVEEDNIKIHGI